MSIRKIASIASIALGVVMIIAAAATRWMVTSELDDQEIVTPEDACLPERQVRGPFTAWCQAEIIDEHTREITDGLTYAQLEQDDPRRETAMDASFLRFPLHLDRRLRSGGHGRSHGHPVHPHRSWDARRQPARRPLLPPGSAAALGLGVEVDRPLPAQVNVPSRGPASVWNGLPKVPA